MGTSRSNKAPNKKAFRKAANSLKSPVRNTSNIVQLTLLAALDYIPTRYTGSPIVFAAAEGTRFAILVKEKGFKQAVKEEAIHIIKSFIAPSVSYKLWQATASRMDPKFSNSPYGQLAEKAFKKTLSSIITKGSKALEE